MLQSFKNFISDHRLFNREHKLLLALSGGADSVCLFHLLQQGGFDFSVAHCNFKLRGLESDADEQFVIDLAKSKNVPYNTISFDTAETSLKEKTGIQETARKLRYDWFSELMENGGFYKLLTAHHQTDNLETMLINVLRSTGIKGLHGIPMDENNMARPLLFATRNEIEAYLKTENISYGEDQSNATDNYLRNRLRHNVLPELKNINADVEQCFFDTAQKVRSYEAIANELIGKQWMSIIETGNDTLKIDIAQLNRIENKLPFLFYNLQPYGFSYHQVQSILDADQPGKAVFSDTHEIVKERGYYLLRPFKDESAIIEMLIHGTIKNVEVDGQLIDFNLLDNSEAIDYKEKNRLYLNADNLEFPIRLRTWKQGDKLKPLGMTGYKKVSDVLTDRKVENHQRKSFLVIEITGNEVIALLPDTIHNDYKILPSTKRVLSIGIKIAESYTTQLKK